MEARTSFGLYRKSGALRIDHQTCSLKDGKPRLGGFFLKFAPAGGSGTKYDWNNGAVTMFVSGQEATKICRMLEHPEVDMKIYHDPSKGGNEGDGKQISVNADDKGTIYINAFSGTKKIGIVVYPEDVDSIGVLIRSGLPSCFGWQTTPYAGTPLPEQSNQEPGTPVTGSTEKRYVP